MVVRPGLSFVCVGWISGLISSSLLRVKKVVDWPAWSRGCRDCLWRIVGTVQPAHENSQHPSMGASRPPRHLEVPPPMSVWWFFRTKPRKHSSARLVRSEWHLFWPSSRFWLLWAPRVPSPSHPVSGRLSSSCRLKWEVPCPGPLWQGCYCSSRCRYIFRNFS